MKAINPGPGREAGGFLLEPTTVTVPTTAIAPDSAKSMMGK